MSVMRTMAIVAVGAVSLVACASNTDQAAGHAVVGETLAAATGDSSPPTFLVIAGESTTLPPMPPDAIIEPTSIYYPPSATTTIVPSVRPVVQTTTLPIGPRDKTDQPTGGLPTSLDVRLADLVDDHWNDLGPTFTIAKGAVVNIALSDDMRLALGASQRIGLPTSADTAVVRPIVPRGECPPEWVCATFEAISAGSSEIDITTPYGNGLAPGIIVLFLQVA